MIRKEKEKGKKKDFVLWMIKSRLLSFLDDPIFEKKKTKKKTKTKQKTKKKRKKRKKKKNLHKRKRNMQPQMIKHSLNIKMVFIQLLRKGGGNSIQLNIKSPLSSHGRIRRVIDLTNLFQIPLLIIIYKQILLIRPTKHISPPPTPTPMIIHRIFFPFFIFFSITITCEISLSVFWPWPERIPVWSCRVGPRLPIRHLFLSLHNPNHQTTHNTQHTTQKKKKEKRKKKKKIFLLTQKKKKNLKKKRKRKIQPIKTQNCKEPTFRSSHSMFLPF